MVILNKFSLVPSEGEAAAVHESSPEVSEVSLARPLSTAGADLSDVPSKREGNVFPIPFLEAGLARPAVEEAVLIDTFDDLRERLASLRPAKASNSTTAGSSMDALRSAIAQRAWVNPQWLAPAPVAKSGPASSEADEEVFADLRPAPASVDEPMPAVASISYDGDVIEDVAADMGAEADVDEALDRQMIQDMVVHEELAPVFVVEPFFPFPVGEDGFAQVIVPEAPLAKEIPPAPHILALPEAEPEKFGVDTRSLPEFGGDIAFVSDVGTAIEVLETPQETPAAEALIVSAQPKLRTGWLMAGTAVAASGLTFLFSAVALLVFNAEVRVAEPLPVASAALLPVMQWDKLQAQQDGSFVSKMEFANGKWEITRIPAGGLTSPAGPTPATK